MKKVFLLLSVFVTLSLHAQQSTTIDDGSLESKKNSFKIFPTLCQSSLHIEGELLSSKENVQYKLMDMLGKVVQSGTLTKTIDVKELPNESYMIFIYSGKTALQITKFIVSNGTGSGN